MYIVSLGTYNVEKLKKILEVKFCEPVVCVQQTKNGLRTKFRRFSHILS